MAIEFKCPTCSSPFKVSDGLAGRVSNCPRCKEVVRVPGDPPKPLPEVPDEIPHWRRQELARESQVASGPQAVSVTKIELSLGNMLQLIALFWVSSGLLIGAVVIVLVGLGVLFHQSPQ